MKFTKKSKKRNNKNKTRKKRGGAVPIMYDISAREMPNPIPLMCPICKNQNFFLKHSMLRGGRIASFFEINLSLTISTAIFTADLAVRFPERV